MGVAVAGIDCRAGLAGGRRARDMTGTESQRLAARPREHDGAAAETRDEDARHRPGIGQDHGLTSLPVASVAAKARSSRTCASSALAMGPPPGR